MAGVRLNDAFTLRVYALFGHSPLYRSNQMDSAWTEISEYVQGIRTFTGRRDYDTINMDINEATIVLFNQDRRFDPTNLSGPYVASSKTQVRPTVQIKVLYEYTTYNTSTSSNETNTYALFSGFATEWKQIFDEHGKIQQCKLKCKDILYLLNQFRYEGTRPQEYPYNTAGDILDDFGNSYQTLTGETSASFGYSNNVLTTGMSINWQFPAQSYNGPALNILGDVYWSANAFLMASPSGAVYSTRLPTDINALDYQGNASTNGRRALFANYDSIVEFNPAGDIPASSSSSTVPYSRITFGASKDKIKTSINYAPLNTPTTFSTATTTQGVQDYGYLTMSRSGHLYNNAYAATSFAKRDIQGFMSSNLLVDTITIPVHFTSVVNKDSAWDIFVRGIIGDQVSTTTTNPYTDTKYTIFAKCTVKASLPDGSNLDEKFIKGGIQTDINIKNKTFDVKLHLEPVAITRCWILGKADFSEVGISTMLVVP